MDKQLITKAEAREAAFVAIRTYNTDNPLRPISQDAETAILEGISERLSRPYPEPHPDTTGRVRAVIALRNATDSTLLEAKQAMEACGYDAEKAKAMIEAGGR